MTAPTPYPSYDPATDVINVDVAGTLKAKYSESFATDNKLDLPLAAPSTQTILPVICAGVLVNDGINPPFIDGTLSVNPNKILGWIPIASTVFNGTERSFSTSDGPIYITTVTLPELVDNPERTRVRQYMAAIFPADQERVMPWLGYEAFIPVDYSEYAMRWFMPTMGQMYRLNLGPLVTDLTIGMDKDEGSPPTPPTPPVVTPGTLRWATSVEMNALQAECPFIDFNWVNLFKAQSGSTDPLRIEIVSNPAGGEFKTTIVPYPVIAPLGGVEFNTLRIIKLKEAAAGAYVFNYSVVDTNGQATPVVLTLNIV